MKSEVVECFQNCLECQQVKVEHQYPTGLLQLLPFPEWKWEIITLDFSIGLPKLKRKNDSIMVMVDKLRKIKHFISLQLTNKDIQIVDIFMREFFHLHGIPKIEISN